jgi:hypothetical protein
MTTRVRAQRRGGPPSSGRRSLSLAVASLPTWLVAVLFIVVVPLVVVAVQIGIRRRWPALAEGEHNEVAAGTGALRPDAVIGPRA